MAADLFTRYVTRHEPDIRLAEAALLYATAFYPQLNLTRYILWLDAQGYRARERFDPGSSQAIVIAGLNDLLFDELGFHGNAEQYYDERNSYLNEVIDRRTGIPITLSLVYIEIGRRAGLQVDGIGLPGHFVVRVRGRDWDALVDPFNRGAVLTNEACEQLMAQVAGRPSPLMPHHLQPVGHRAFLARMLNNLQSIHEQDENWPRALHAMQAIEALLHPGGIGPEFYRSRGLAHFKLSHWSDAERDWLTYLTQVPNAPDAAAIHQNIRHIRETLARRN
ncbi:MAG: transglutaminase family protein [Chloroflexi bacterium]|nr:transglutaminase family protein [Chloroflexota bacterium]